MKSGFVFLPSFSFLCNLARTLIDELCAQAILTGLMTAKHAKEAMESSSVGQYLPCQQLV